MAGPTQRRGSGDTRADAPSAVLPRVRAGTGRALRAALLVAFLLHLPFVPNLSGWFEVLMNLRGGEVEDYDAGETIIPLDLDLLSTDPIAADQSPAASPTGAAPPTTAAPPPPAPAPVASAPAPGAGAPDAGAPDAAAPDAGDAGRPPKPRDPPDGGPDAGPADKPPPDDGNPKLRDPLSVAGAPGKLAAKDPNVQVLISGDRIRKHDLGEWFGRLLTTIPEWQSFFKDTPIDPIRDLDHLLIAGPQFRNSSKVVAVMDYRAPEAAMRAALDTIVQRTGGAWLPDAPVPTARAKAERAERLFALIPRRRLLVILPADQEGELEKLKSIKPFNRSSQAGIVLSMLTPANAFKNVYKLPQTLKWMRLTVTPTQDGGADLALTVGDSSADNAEKHADVLTSALNAARTIDIGITTIDVLDQVKFSNDGDVIWTRLHVQSKQLKLIMGFVEEGLKEQAKKREKAKENEETTPDGGKPEDRKGARGTQGAQGK